MPNTFDFLNEQQYQGLNGNFHLFQYPTSQQYENFTHQVKCYKNQVIDEGAIYYNFNDTSLTDADLPFETRILTLANGNYVTAEFHKNNQYTYGCGFIFYDSSDNIIFKYQNSWNGLPSWIPCSCRVAYAYCDGDDDYLFGYGYIDPTPTSFNMHFQPYVENPNNSTYAFRQWLAGQIVPTYTWKSWNQINGNSGQYRCRLTMIDEDELSEVNISGYHGYDDENFTRVSNESSIWNTFLNAQDDVEYDVAWSGRCKATLTVTDYLSDNAIKIFTFKFYFPDQTTPFFTKSEYVTYSSSTPSNNVRNYYLSFLYDNDAQAAAFYGIRYNPQSVDLFQTLG